jgi:excisionase family DNA binding protein
MAARLELSMPKVRALIHAQKLPAEKVGTVWVSKVGDPAPETALTHENGEEKFLSVRETADCLHMPPQKARKLIYSGKLPALKVGRNWVIRESALSPAPGAS